MKKTLIISLLSLATFQGFAQSADGPVSTNNAVCKKAPNMPRNAVMVWPKEAYIPTQDPSCAPCYEYKTKHGLLVMECPFIIPIVPDRQATAGVEMQSQKVYTGNYPFCKRNPAMPANAKPVWPKENYLPKDNSGCAPCYEYTTKHGLDVMECPDVLMLPASNE